MYHKQASRHAGFQNRKEFLNQSLLSIGDVTFVVDVNVEQKMCYS